MSNTQHWGLPRRAEEEKSKQHELVKIQGLFQYERSGVVRCPQHGSKGDLESAFKLRLAECFKGLKGIAALRWHSGSTGDISGPAGT